MTQTQDKTEITKLESPQLHQFGNMRVESWYDDINALRVLATVPGSFARSLYQQAKSDWKAKGYNCLTQKQWYYVHKLANPQPVPATPNAAAKEVDFAAINQLFENAKNSGIKHPKIRLAYRDDGLIGTGRTTVIRLSVAGARSKTPGAIRITSDSGYSTSIFYGYISTSGKLVQYRAMTGSVAGLVLRFAADPANVAAEYGKLMNRCSFCKIPLTDDRSVVMGYGPICASNWGLPWGTQAMKDKLESVES